MQTQLADFIRNTPEGEEAESILRSCVHCGFCTATCPTYQLLGDELDGPRGRIYLMKQALEGHEVTAKTQLHLDRCLTCRSCETTCPSGVKYGRLLDIGRAVVERKVGRPAGEARRRTLLRKALLNRTLFDAALGVGRLVRPLLPEGLRRKVPARVDPGPWPAPRHARRMLVLKGCVQPSLDPRIDAAMARVLDRIGISLEVAAGGGCCGALEYHLNAQEEGLEAMRRNVDAWWPHVEKGAEAVVVTASGCGVTVKEYGHLLRDDARYAERAAKISALAKDPVEVLSAEWARVEPLLRGAPSPKRIAFHPPCTLQHGMKLRGAVEKLLVAMGYELTPVQDAHLCCGSAGSYSILQPELSERLKANKVAALEAGTPEMIVSANIGCQVHLQTGTTRPVRHWVEVVDGRLGG